VALFSCGCCRDCSVLYVAVMGFTRLCLDVLAKNVLKGILLFRNREMNLYNKLN